MFNLLPLYLFPLQIRLLEGFYLSDLSLIVVLLSWRLRSRFSGINRFFTLYLMLVILACLATLNATSVALLNAEWEINYYWLPLKVGLFILYSIYFTQLRASGFQVGNIKPLLFVFLFPMVVSIAAYENSLIRQAMVLIWGVVESDTSRYGGIFGADVNAFGMYCSLMLLVSFVMFQYKLLSIVPFIITIGLSIVGVSLSGMRTGYIAALLSFVLVFSFNFHFKILIAAVRIIQKNAFTFAGLLVATILVFSMAGYIFNVLDIDTDRFSFDVLLSDFDFRSGEGNLAVAIEYFHSSFPRDFNFYDILFGYSPGSLYLDNLYLAVFAKYGIGVLIVMFVILIYATFMAWGNALYQFLLFFSIIVGVKGVFPGGNYFMFMVLFIVFLHEISVTPKRRQQKKSNLIL